MKELRLAWRALPPPLWGGQGWGVARTSDGVWQDAKAFKACATPLLDPPPQGGRKTPCASQRPSIDCPGVAPDLGKCASASLLGDEASPHPGPLPRRERGCGCAPQSLANPFSRLREKVAQRASGRTPVLPDGLWRRLRGEPRQFTSLDCSGEPCLFSRDRKAPTLS